LVSGTTSAALFHGISIAQGAEPGIKGAWLTNVFRYESEMGQNFWMAIVAWTTCFVVTLVVSLLTRRTKTDQELTGLVYSLTPKPDSGGEAWYKQPVTIGILVLIATAVLNLIFR